MSRARVPVVAAVLLAVLSGCGGTERPSSLQEQCSDGAPESWESRPDCKALAAGRVAERQARIAESFARNMENARQGEIARRACLDNPYLDRVAPNRVCANNS